MTWRIVQGDCLVRMREMPDNSVDACVTDPPYGLSFMGKKWDCEVPGVDVWREVLRVLKPGGHLLCFAGTRTQHRMACAIEDAGFEIRDCIMWVYGSGFPKSLAVGKAIDREAGAAREVVGDNPHARPSDGQAFACMGTKTHPPLTAPATPEAAAWEGWGTALKPALEPITVARKPLGSTVASNVLKWGTGAINVDGCRVGAEPITQHGRGDSQNVAMSGRNYAEPPGRAWTGRWPSNLIHDGSQEVLELFPDRPGMSGGGTGRRDASMFGVGGVTKPETVRGDNGSAARFFYCAKASKRDREDGLGEHHNDHPTVKPTDLMRYLCRLVTPPGGLVLDPFAGSGSTGRGALLEGFRFLGIEREHEYADIAAARMEAIECQRQ